MKKIILSAVALAAFSFTAQAQEMKFGAKAGVNFANVSGDDAFGDTKTLTGFHAGVLAEFKLTENFSVQPELLYSMQGAKVEGATVIGTSVESFEGKRKLGYLNIPIMAKYYVIEGLSIEAGPQVGFLLNAEDEIDYTFTSMLGTISESETTDVKDQMNSVDFGFNFGAGYETEMGLFLQARYNMGLSKLGKEYTDSDGVTYKAADIKNSVLSVSVGYKF